MTGKADVAAVRHFRENSKAVYELMRFDTRLVELIVGPLKRVGASQTTGGITNPRHRVDHLIEQFARIRENESLGPYYQAMFNQCVVLLVSYFAAAARELFIDAAAAALDAGTSRELLDADVRLTPRAFRESSRDTSHLLAEMIADGKEMSYQDMQSIDRAFRKFLDAGIERDSVINNIVVAQACRHVIVHAGGSADARYLAQVRPATPRTLKPNLSSDVIVQFSRDEAIAVAKDMLTHLRRLADAVEKGGVRLSRSAAG